MFSQRNNAMKVQRRENKRRGIWIRMQYFNLILGLFIWALLMVVLITFMPYVIRWLGADIIPDESAVRSFQEFLFGYCVWYLLPLGLLSVLNAFVFGHKLCHVSKEGMHIYGKILAWDSFDIITYSPAAFPRHNIDFCRTQFEMSDGMIFEVEHFPLYGVLLVKCFAPRVRIRLSGWGWFIVALFSLLPIIFGLIATFD